MYRFCSPCSVGSSWPCPTTSAVRAAIRPSSGQWFLLIVFLLDRIDATDLFPQPFGTEALAPVFFFHCNLQTINRITYSK